MHHERTSSRKSLPAEVGMHIAARPAVAGAASALALACVRVVHESPGAQRFHFPRHDSGFAAEWQRDAVVNGLTHSSTQRILACAKYGNGAQPSDAVLGVGRTDLALSRCAALADEQFANLTAKLAKKSYFSQKQGRAKAPYPSEESAALTCLAGVDSMRPHEDAKLLAYFRSN